MMLLLMVRWCDGAHDDVDGVDECKRDDADGDAVADAVDECR